MHSPLILCRSARRDENGVALVIVLTFVVLLTGLMVAFFSRSVTSRQLSNSSAGQTKAALLARSAADIVVAGFKKEIVAGSMPTPITTGTKTTNLYFPIPPPNGPASAYMVPVRYPTPAPNTGDPIPNFVRESKSGDSTGGALPVPAVPSYASAINSTNDRAVGGRAVSLARWNSHFLVPSQSTTTTANSTPDTTVGFTPPDWVMVTEEKGPTVLSSPATDSSGASVTPIGRYAYAVYDEGGLLDMNVAGHPTSRTTPAATGFTPTQVSQKGSSALADLTQLPTTAGASPTYLTQNVVDQIVGWRNYQSAGLSGSSFPNFTFTPAQADAWFKNFASNNTTGFLSVYKSTSSSTGLTDQAFISRQQLINLQKSLQQNQSGSFPAAVLQ